MPLTLGDLYHANGEKAASEKKADDNSKDLKQKLEAAAKAETTAIQDQKNNTEIFTKQFKGLSDELSDLKTQVTTAPLLKKIGNLQTELQNTQQAMKPGPKATLTFTFAPFDNPFAPAHMPEPAPVAHAVTDIELPVAADGSVHVQFAILNLTAVDALNVSVTFIICDGCTFAKDPEGFTKLPGSPDTQRFIALPQIHAFEALRAIATDITVPPTASAVNVGILYRCNTCVLTRDYYSGVVHLRRDFIKPEKMSAQHG